MDDEAALRDKLRKIEAQALNKRRNSDLAARSNERAGSAHSNGQDTGRGARGGSA